MKISFESLTTKIKVRTYSPNSAYEQIMEPRPSTLVTVVTDKEVTAYHIWLVFEKLHANGDTFNNLI